MLHDPSDEKIIARFELQGGGQLQLGFGTQTGLVVGTSPLMGRIINVTGWADMWFVLQRIKSQVKIMSDPRIKSGMIPEWLYIDYLNGLISKLKTLTDDERERLLKMHF